MAETIVVGYDGSEHAKKALDAAIEWARQTPESEIAITCPQERPAPGIAFRGLEFGVEEMFQELVKRVEAELAEAAARCREAGVKAATVCTADTPEETIMKVAQETGARMIVIGVKGVGARKGEHTHLGSTTNRVLHEAGGKIPILIV